jgi:hypothetical protein
LDTETTSVKKRRRFRFSVRTAVFLLTFAALVTLAVTIGSRFSSARAIADARREISAKGYATTPEEYAARLPVIPDDQNAALNYMEAAKLLDVIGRETSDKYVPLFNRHLSLRSQPTEKLRRAAADLKSIDADPRIPLPDYIVADSSAFLDARRDVLALLATASSLPKSRFPVDLPSRFVGPPREDSVEGQLPNLYFCTRLLCLDAWLLCEARRPHEAVASLRSAMALVSALLDEGLLIIDNRITGFSLVTGSVLPHLVGRADVANEDLAPLQRDLERCANGLSIRPALEGGIVSILAECDAVLRKRKAFYRGYRGVLPSDYYNLTGAPADLLNKLTAAKGLFIRDGAMLARMYACTLDDVDGVTRAFIAGQDPLAAKRPSGRFFAAQSKWVKITTVVRSEKFRASARSAASVCAALRYRNDHNAWPESLAALVPEYIAAVPEDPFTGKPLIYLIEPNGIAVYSVGENLTDDGGDGFLGVPGMPVRGDDVGLRIMK